MLQSRLDESERTPTIAMKFNRTPLPPSISVDQLISFHYFEYASGFVFDGEHHDFWEFLYVDKGQVQVQADKKTFELRQGHIIFHRPDEFHTVRVLPQHKPPNLIVISFDCVSPSMAHFRNKVLMLGDHDRLYLSQALQEGFRVFSPPYDNHADHTLVRQPNAPFGGEQLIKMHLEMLLISLVRSFLRDADPGLRPLRQTTANKANFEQDIAHRIDQFLRENLTSNLSLDQVCSEFHLGKSRLKDIFHACFGSGVMERYKLLKFEEAKSLIRERKYNFTEIAGMLGYASIHYFSREFKKHAGMSPSEYARTVQAQSGHLSR